MRLLYLFIFIILCKVFNTHYSVYHSDQSLSTNFGFDCLYGHLTDNEEYEDIRSDTTYHLISYCRRPIEHDDDENEKESILSTENIYNNITFTELYQYGVTTEQLLNWSAPIDLVEQYAMKDNTDRIHIFYNCSLPWFGPKCQYKFDNNAFLSFNEILRLNFLTRIRITNTLPDFDIDTCYPFLINCSYKLPFMCLDWREICDGKYDCMNGEDEQNCETMEIFECPENTYRCHYGGQCIPLTFVRDKHSHIDCLDGTDETVVIEQENALFGAFCYTIPTFQCEEHMSRYQFSFQCGDGYYYPYHLNTRTKMSCANGRFLKLKLSRNDSFSNISKQSWKELLESTLISNMHIWYRTLTNSNSMYTLLSCKSTNRICLSNWFFKVQLFNTHPMFHFIYLSNRSFSDFYHYVQPNYICFYPQDCLPLVKDAIDIGLNNGLICYYTNDISEESITNETQIRKVLDKLFLRCVTTGIERTCSHSSLFHCPISLKCISKHRLVDGISDCYYNEDELFDSCQLNDSQRFICSSEPNKCLAPIALYNRKYECQGKEDEMDEIQRNILKGYVPIGLICDGVKEQLLEHANDTDETNCEYWPCNNPYTRCNGVSTCLDGTDELNCPLLEYSINTGQCSKQIVTNLFCERAIHSIANKFDSKIVHVTNNTVLDYATNKNRTKCFITPKCYSLPQICQFDILNTLFDQLCHLPEALVCLLELFYWKPILRTNICHFNLYTSSKDDQVQSAFTSTQLGYFPIVSSALSNSNNSNMKTTTNIETLTKTFKNWYCNRGILVFHKNNQTKTCLCPPTYFGHRCQWQNQRLSLTFQFIYQTNTYNTILIFQLIIMLIDQQKHMTSYHEQILYIPKENCDTKYNIYLLYPTRPKNLSINYTIHIDIFDKVTLTYYGSWFLSIPFQFLPVNRIATQIFIPTTPKMISKSCPLVCGHHGQCVEYLNQNNSYFCQCHQGYSGLHCHIPHHCSCSSDSLCLSSSICVCPVNKFGSKCYLNHSICQQSTNPCQNHGFCVPVDDRMGLKKFFCLCPDGFSGRTCEHHQNRLDIRFDPKKITMTPFIYVHSIRALKNDNHQYTTILKKVHPEQNLLTIYVKFPFHLIFIELFDHTFYLAVLREKFLESEHIQTNIVFNQRCVHISELMNELFLDYSFLHRVKYYPLLCQENLHLMCFYDEKQMCTCDRSRFSNCFTFNIPSLSYDCQGRNICENNGLCLQDNPACPTQSICVCRQCFYGTKCQFSMKGFVSSLDYILGYHIIPNRSINQQSFIIKMTIVIITIMFCLGLLNGFLSIVTYRIKEIKCIGCGSYLLVSSWNSMFLIIMLEVKCWHLLLSQMSVLNNRSYLKFTCLSLDVILNVLIATNDWFGGCISIEQVFNTFKGVNFNQNRSKKLAKRIIFGIYILTILTNIHDPFYRQLIDDIDIDERRTWCIVQYSPTIDTYNTIVTFFHFLMPLSINFLSTFIVIFLMAQSRSTTRSQITFNANLREQFHQHKHNLIATCALFFLALPRLIISFVSRCMKSSQDPSLFLIGYLISFIPSMMTFFVFIMSADGYKEEFYASVRRFFTRIHRMRVGVLVNVMNFMF